MAQRKSGILQESHLLLRSGYGQQSPSSVMSGTAENVDFAD